MPARRWNQIALAGILVGALLRALWIFVLHQPFDHVYSDMSGYVDRAKKLATGGDLQPFDGHYPPGTHLLLAVPMRFLGVGPAGLWGGAVLWWMLSSLAPLFMWRLGLVLLTPAAAALTAVLCALWPLHIAYAGYFSSETPSIALLSGSLWLIYRARRATRRGDMLTRGLAAGALAGAAVAVRAQFALNALVAGVGMLRRPAQRVALAGAIAGGALVLAIPIVHNTIAEGRLAGPDGHGGLVFFVGHCDVREVRTHREGEFVFGPPPAAQRGTGRVYDFPDHAVWDAGFFYEEGLKCIRDNGVEHLPLITRAVGDMTALTLPWPPANEDKLREVVTVTNFVYVFALPIIVIGAFLLVQKRRAQGQDPGGVVAMLLHLAMIVPVAVIAGLGEPRYRTPYDLFGLALLAAIVAARWFDRPRRVGL